MNFLLVAIELLLITLYVTILIVLIVSKRVFNSAFYSLFIAVGIVDLISYFSNLFFRLLRAYNFQLQFTYIDSLFSILGGGSFIAHFLGQTLININRYTSICHPMNHSELWNKSNTILAILLQYALPFGTTLVADIICGVEMVWTDQGNGIMVYVGATHMWSMVSGFLFSVTCSLFFIFSPIINFLMLKTWDGYSKSLDNNCPASKKTERSLLFFCLYTCIICLFMAILQIVKLIAAFVENQSIIDATTFVFYRANDILVFLNPLTLLIFCKEFHRELSTKFFRLLAFGGQRIFQKNTKSVIEVRVMETL